MSRRPLVGQLTYCILPGGDGRSGGWQVVQVSGHVPRGDKALMLGEVCTSLDPVTATPRFPTAEQILARPRRLTFRGFLEAGVWSHAVPAGTDRTGRGGNVFTHVMLAARWGLGDQTPDVSRPVEWCTAPWLTPFGPEEIAAAAFDDDDPPSPPDPWTLRMRVLERLFDAQPQAPEPVLAAWLDAIAWALPDGALPSGLPYRESRRCVVLGLADMSTATWWLAMASYLTEPLLCRRMSFSTYDRLPPLFTEPAPPRLTVRVVPRDDLRGWREEAPADVMPFDVLDPPTLTGDRWVGPWRVSFEEAAWGRCLRDLLHVGPQAAMDVLVRLDQDALERSSRGAGTPGQALQRLLHPPPRGRPSPGAPGGGPGPAAVRHPPDDEPIDQPFRRTVEDHSVADPRGHQ